MIAMTKKISIALAVLACVAGGALAACDGENSNAVKEPIRPVDSGILPLQDSAIPTDGALLPDGAPSDCVLNPKTHEEIINGCTDAVRITKNPTLPLLLPDGGLPPLP